jgi:hypothetical protein
MSQLALDMEHRGQVRFSAHADIPIARH